MLMLESSYDIQSSIYTPSLTLGPLPAGRRLLPIGPVGLPEDSLVLPLQPASPFPAEVAAEVTSFAQLTVHPGWSFQRGLTAFLEFVQVSHHRVEPKRADLVGPCQPCRELRKTSRKSKTLQFVFTWDPHRKNLRPRDPPKPKKTI